jgi:uncharacterized protein (TIGR03435 family)
MRATGAAAMILWGLSFTVARAQSSQPRFELVSIKRNISGPSVSPVTAAGDRFTTKAANLIFVLQYAYQRSDGTKLRYSDIIGGPEWANSDAFDIQAKAEGAPPSQDQMRLMVQALLADRFKLKAHIEKRELPVYELVVVNSGPKLKPADLQSSGKRQLIGLPSPSGSLTLKMTNTRTSLSTLSSMLQSYAGRPIIDKTGLEGQFDVSLQFAPETLPADPSDASLFTAVQEQLGLKLEPAKGQVEVLLIDSVERPSDN